MDKVHQQVKDDLKGKGKLDSGYKLTGNMSGREIAEQLHELYKDSTKYFHPDF